MKLKPFVICTSFVIGLLSGTVFGSPSIDALLVEAKTKHASKDYAGAAKVYKVILDLDSEHREARVGLAAVLMQAQHEAYTSDESDALNTLIDPKSAEPLVE